MPTGLPPTRGSPTRCGRPSRRWPEWTPTQALHRTAAAAADFRVQAPIAAAAGELVVRRGRRRVVEGVDWPEQTLTQLEGDDWGEPTYPSYVVTNSHRLRHKPLREFTAEDLRFILGQQTGLPVLMPMALDVLEADPFA